LADILRGGCLCGDVRYELREEPLTAVFCHCRGCQLAHASPSSALALIPFGGVSILTGSPVRREHLAESGVANFREFCGSCGSQLFSGNVDSREFLSVKIVTLDDPSSISPVAHVYMKRKINWDPVEDGLPQFSDFPEIAELKRLWSIAQSGAA
jgi:hypothetical protein